MNTTYLTKANFKIKIGTTLISGVTEADIPELFKMEMDHIFQKMCVISFQIPKTIQEYREKFENIYSKRRFFQFIIYSSNNQVIGTIYTIDFNKSHKTSHFCIYVKREFWGNVNIFKGTFLFLRFLFECHATHKIYTDIFDFNSRSLKIVERIGFSKEGYFPEHYQTKTGERFDYYRFAMYSKQMSKNPHQFRLNENIEIIH